MKNITLLFISIVSFCLASCSKHIPAEFEVVSMSLSNAQNTGESPSESTNNNVPKQAYAIKMILNEEMRKKTDGDAQENGFINEDKLVGLNIFSLYAFDASHPANTSLNDYFLTSLSSSSTISNFISKGQIGGGSFKNGNYTDSWSTNQYLYLMTPPALPGPQSFVVKMDLSDGRSMCDTVNVTLY